MPPRIHPPSRAIASILRCKRPLRISSYATAAAALTPTRSALPTIARYPSTQPPSHKPAEFRKTQLLRQYTSLLRSTPLMLLFQHNNLLSNEWVGIRRELSIALRKVDDARVAAGHTPEPLADVIKITIMQTGIFAAALKVVEFYKPEAPHPNAKVDRNGDGLTHSLSEAAHQAVANKKHGLAPLLSGPLCVLTFPDVSPQHLKAALSILSPSPPQFPAPSRKANPGYHDAAVQGGLSKLLLLGARVEGKVFDVEKTKWVGGIDGGLEGLRAQLVHLLQSFGAGVTNTLESASKSLYFTVEGRRTMLEDEEKAANGEGPKEEAK